MIITLNERVWIEDVISKKVMGDSPFRTLVILAKYYFDKGYSKKEVRKKTEAFLMQCRPYESPVKWGKTLDNAVSYGEKEGLIEIDKINITESEMKSIQALESIRCRRLAFTLLCLAKYQTDARGKEPWVDISMKGLMSMANVTVSGDKKNQLFYNIISSGLILPSRRVDSTYVKVIFIDNDSPVVMEITDFRNLGYQYMRYYGGKYYECANCGIVIPLKNKSGRPPKYCKDCANKVRIKQNVESVMRQREKQKLDKEKS